MGTSHFYLANVLPLIGKTAEAQVEFRTALGILQVLLDDNPAVTRLRRNLGLCRSYFGALLLQIGKPTEAEAECRNAMSALEKLVDEDPSDTDLRSILSECHMTLGVLLLQAGKRADAEVACRNAQAIAERLTTDYPSFTYHRFTLSMAFDVLGEVVRASGRAAEAKSYFDRAIALQEQGFKKEPALPWSGYGIVYSKWRRGLTLRDLGDPAGAAADARQALSLCDGALPQSGTHSFETACCHATLASLAGRAGSGVSPVEGEQEAARAMEWLGRAIANGFHNTNQLHIESALDSLRDRPDFKKLIAELEKNTPSQQEMK